MVPGAGMTFDGIHRVVKHNAINTIERMRLGLKPVSRT
jgi:hypothetical protein